jgi:hypothetical protein
MVDGSGVPRQQARSRGDYLAATEAENVVPLRPQAASPRG